MALRLISTLGQPDDDSHIEKKSELTEHLAELRTRLMRAAVYLVVGGCVAYFFFPQIFAALAEPVNTALKEIALKHHGALSPFPPGTFVFRQFFGPFFLRLQLSIYCGIVVASPFVVAELWGFVSPGLTPAERRPVRLVAPFSIALFILGAGLAFWIMPMAVKWFLSYLADFPGAVLLQDPQDYILFLVKMLLVFGLMFQLPIIMLALGKVGIIRSKMLWQYWRHIVVGITVVAMVVTPSNDPFSMIVMAVPLVILFFVSIALVRMVEPKQPAG